MANVVLTTLLRGFCIDGPELVFAGMLPTGSERLWSQTALGRRSAAGERNRPTLD